MNRHCGRASCKINVEKCVALQNKMASLPYGEELIFCSRLHSPQLILTFKEDWWLFISFSTYI